MHKICPFLGMGLGYSVQLERWRQMSTTTVISSLTYDVCGNLGKNDFDLFELTEEERAELANAFKDDSESGDELDDENQPLFFTGSATF